MSEYLSLKDYDSISVKILSKHNIKPDDENIAFVNEMMMKADMIYDQGKVGHDINIRKNFRIFYAKFACLNIKKKYYNKSNYKSLYNKNKKIQYIKDEVIDVNNNQVVDVYIKELQEKALEILRESSSNYQNVFKLYVIDKLTITEVSKELNISYEAVRKIISLFPKKLKKLQCQF